MRMGRACASTPRQRNHVPRTDQGRCRLVVVAIKTCGRWSDEAVELIRLHRHEGSSSASAHVVADNLGVATPMVQDALHRVLRVVCGLPWCQTGGEPPPFAEFVSWCDASGRTVPEFSQQQTKSSSCSCGRLARKVCGAVTPKNAPPQARWFPWGAGSPWTSSPSPKRISSPADHGSLNHDPGHALWR